MTFAAKTNPGNFFEDFSVGQVIEHATPRTVTEGDRALYGALYPTRFAVPSSAEFARVASGWPPPGGGPDRVPRRLRQDGARRLAQRRGQPRLRRVPLPRAGRTRRHPPHPSEVIGLKQNSNGQTGVVWVRSTATNQRGEVVIDWARWVMVHKRTRAAGPRDRHARRSPTRRARGPGGPAGLDFSSYDVVAAGEPHRLGDYEVGERIDHVDGMTLTDAEHMMATRLWQNTAKVHFNTDAPPRRPAARSTAATSSRSRGRCPSTAWPTPSSSPAINAGAHVAPAFAGDTVYAWSEVLDTATLDAAGVGALRLRLVATQGRDESMTLRGDDRTYADGVLLDLDCWALVPR